MQPKKNIRDEGRRLVALLLNDRRKRKESRNAQAGRLGLAESTLRKLEETKRPSRNTCVLLSSMLTAVKA